MISTLASRKFSGFPSIDDLPQQALCFKVCKCPPKTRIRGKSSPGCSCFAQPSLILANLEHRFASAASNGQITAALFHEICQHYRQFADQLDEWKTLAPWALFALPSDVPCKKYHRSMTNRILDSLRSYVEAVNISLDHRDSESRVPWLLVFLDFCTQSSDVAWLESQGSFHKAVCHFRVMFTSVARACGHRIHPHKKVSLLHDFGFGSLTGFIGGIRLRYPLRVWFALVYAALSFVSASVDKFEPDAVSSFVRFVLYPILWRLIQFRGETANWAPPFNGRRAREAGPFAAKKNYCVLFQKILLRVQVDMFLFHVFLCRKDTTDTTYVYACNVTCQVLLSLSKYLLDK